MPEIPEPKDWNQVATLLESIDHKMRVVAEGVTGLRSEFDTFKIALEDVDERLGRLEPIVNTLGPVPKKLDDLERKLDTFNQRLAAVESK